MSKKDKLAVKKWVDTIIGQGERVSMYQLFVELIDNYNLTGCGTQLDTQKPSDQLSFMWRYTKTWAYSGDTKRERISTKAVKGELNIGYARETPLGRWVSSILNPATGRIEHVGTYDKQEEAYEAYQKAKIKMKDR